MWSTQGVGHRPCLAKKTILLRLYFRPFQRTVQYRLQFPFLVTPPASFPFNSL